MKSIARIVHLPSVVQFELYEATRIPFVRKENKNNFFSTIHIIDASNGRKMRTLFCIHLNTRRRILFSFKSTRKYTVEYVSLYCDSTTVGGIREVNAVVPVNKDY